MSSKFALKSKMANSRNSRNMKSSNAQLLEESRVKAQTQQQNFVVDEQDEELVADSQRQIKTEEDQQQPNNQNNSPNNNKSQTPQNNKQSDQNQLKIKIIDSVEEQNSMPSSKTPLQRQERNSVLKSSNSNKNSQTKFNLDVSKVDQNKKNLDPNMVSNDTYENYLSSQRSASKKDYPLINPDQKEKNKFLQLKPPKSNRKKLFIDILDLQNLNITDNIKCVIELIDRDGETLVGEKGECTSTTLLVPRQEDPKLVKFEHQQLFYFNENNVNLKQYIKPKIQISLYLEKKNVLIGFVRMPLIDKKKMKLKKGQFTKKLYSMCKIRNQEVKTPFFMTFILYRDVPQKWIGMIDRTYIPQEDKGLVLSLQNIDNYLEPFNLCAEFALVNNGNIVKDHNLDQILYATSGFNKCEFGWYVHPVFRLREYNTGEFSVNLIKPPCQSKIMYDFENLPRMKARINFRFLGFDETTPKDLEVYSVKSQDFKPNHKMNTSNPDAQTDMSLTEFKEEKQELTSRNQLNNGSDSRNSVQVKKKLRKKIDSTNVAHAMQVESPKMANNNYNIEEESQE